MEVISNVTRRLEEETQQFGAAEAWNRCSVELVEASRVHTVLYIFHCFDLSINAVRSKQSAPLIAVLEKLRSLYALKQIEQSLVHALSSGLLDRRAVNLLHCAVRHLYATLRSDAVALVDSFDIPDFILNSVLGRRDGNIYEAYFDRVKSTSSAVAPYFDKLIRPMIDQPLRSNL
jgi:acyl-CoA oxidase